MHQIRFPPDSLVSWIKGGLLLRGGKAGKGRAGKGKGKKRKKGGRKGREKGREGEGRERGKVASWLLGGWTPLQP